MNKKILVLSLLSLALSQCNLDSDVLASFKGGTITRKELRNFYKLMNAGGRKSEPNHPTVEEQTQLLDTLGLFKLIAQYNAEKNLVSDAESEVFLKITRPQSAYAYLQKELADKLEVEGKLKFAFARIALVASADANANASTEARAKDILEKVQQISSKKDVAKFIAENTDESSRKAIGGLLEPQCLNCGNDPISEITNEAADKLGTWIVKELIEPQDPRMPAPPANAPKPKRFLVIRVEKVETIYAGRLGKFFQRELGKLKSIASDYVNTPGLSEQSKADAKRHYADLKVDDFALRYEEYMKKRFLGNAAMELEERVIKDAGYQAATITQENFNSFNDESVLLTNTKNGETVKYKDVVIELRQLAAATGLDAGKLENKTNVLQFFKHQFIWYKIGDQSKEIKKVYESQQFQEEFALMKLYSLQPLVFKKVLPANLDVSEAEIREQYETGKLFTYAKPNPNNPQDRVPLPYGEVREKIKDELLRAKRQGLAKEFTQKLKTDYQFIVDSKELKPAKI